MQLWGRKHQPDLNDPIEDVLASMKQYTPDSTEYTELLSYLERLMKLKTDKKSRTPISWDTMALVTGNLLGILVIVAYEQKHVMVSKGLGFILKPKSNHI